jgi:hypothetical protein
MNLRSVKFLLIGCTLVHYSYGEAKYAVASIAPELKKNAQAVMRTHDTELFISSSNKATTTIHYAVTILNSNGIDNARFREYYDSFRKITNIKAIIYDAYGEKVRAVAKTEIHDMGAADGFSLFNDLRVKYIDPTLNEFPFTVEYFCETEYNGLIDYPDWMAYSDYDLSVESSSLKVTMAYGMELRYLERNMSAAASISDDGKNKIYSWNVSNLPAIKEEHFALPLSYYTPSVLLAPSRFKIDGYEGGAGSWKEIGDWVNTLNKDRDILPAETVEKIKELTKNASDDRSKIRIVYEYMQNRTRYVSIQIGIGGWQPTDATTVDKLAYGDCKGLANYTKALLKAAGIKSYYTLANAGRNKQEMLASFPSMQFNHAIVCVPLAKDTIWLECTSQVDPFGYSGSFTDDRPVLLITDNGGVLARTKPLTAFQNEQKRSAVVKLDDSGNGEATVKTTYQGIGYESMAPLLREDEKKRKSDLYSRISLPNFELINYHFDEHRNCLPTIDEDLKLKLNNYGNVVNDRILIPLNLLSRSTTHLSAASERKSDIVIRRPFIETDTITYSLPPSFAVIAKPDPISIHTDFGTYQAELIITENELKYIRRFQINKGNYPLNRYNDFCEFLNTVKKDDGNKLVMKRK